MILILANIVTKNIIVRISVRPDSAAVAGDDDDVMNCARVSVPPDSAAVAGDDDGNMDNLTYVIAAAVALSVVLFVTIIICTRKNRRKPRSNEGTSVLYSTSLCDSPYN